MSKVYQKKLSIGFFSIWSERPAFAIAQVEQIHGHRVVHCSQSGEKADGIYAYTDDDFHPLTIKTADCLPIVIIGKKGHAHLHAGWRGVQQEIFLQPEIENIDPVEFYLGPHIQQSSYQVSQEFKQEFPQDEECFLTRDQHLYFSLAKCIEKKIGKKWPNAKISIDNLDTFRSDILHSYRKNATTERNWNVFSLVELNDSPIID
jgi:copper oxidase (laccase) domain-containing protein